MCKESRNVRELRIVGEHYEKPDMQILVFSENDIACNLQVSNGIPESDSGDW